jgi:hypothetical protein
MKPTYLKNRKPSARIMIQGAFIAGAFAFASSFGFAADAAANGPAKNAGGAASDADAMAKKLSNPIAAMISIPFQQNFDWGGGPDGDGFQWKQNFQPVMPFTLNDDWNLITRAIVPYVHQSDVGGVKGAKSGSQTGFMDTVASAWLSPSKPTKSGWIWGAGAAASLPTGSETGLTSNQWGLGPTAIALKMDGKFTYGALVNHIWSATGTGGNDRLRTNNTYLQPFLAYLPGGGITYAVNVESSYNWNAPDGDRNWTVPVNLMVSKMSKIGKFPVQYQIGGRYYLAAPKNGPDFGMRVALTFLLPK